MRNSEKEIIYKMIFNNIIEPAQTEWPTLSATIPKKYKTVQICDNYQKPNAVPKRYAFPIQLVDKYNA